MKSPLLRKILVIIGLTLLLCIPLRMIGVTVWERSSTRDQVRTEFSENTAGSQWLGGPVLVQPYRQRHINKTKDDKGKETISFYWTDEQQYWLPETLDIRGSLENQPRYRGIYKVQLYQSSIQLKGTFNLDANRPVEASDDIVREAPYLSFGVADVRGLNETPQLSVNGKPVTLAAGARLPAFEAGLHAPLETLEESLNVAMSFELKGMESMHILPLGRDTAVTLTSTWPHPSFTGRFLPESPQVGSDGFSARWRTNFLASNMEKNFSDCMGGECAIFVRNLMGVKLIEPVDIYQQSERALKYGFLFVALTFAVFFLFEMLRDLRIHPMQYLLVGGALTLFFMLLVSLSEHIAFAMAYLVAASSCMLLLWFYVSFVLHSVWRGAGFASLIAALFGVLYTLLQSEDYALLLGTTLLFGVLALIMIVTRRLDWFRIGDSFLPAAAVEKGGDVS